MVLRIINGHIFDPYSSLNGLGVLEITEGKISYILCQNTKIGTPAPNVDQTIDAAGNYVFPGFIDIHVHLREPGFSYKETIETGARAAVASGFTTICAMPNTNPTTDNITVVNSILYRAAQLNICRIIPIGAISKNREGKQLAAYDALVKAGVRLFSDDGSDTTDSNVLYNAMLYLKDYPLCRAVIHAEDASMSKGGAINEGAVSREYGFSAQSPLAEILGVNRALLIAEYLDVPVHIAHVSLKQTLDIIRMAKANGQKVTCEVTLHHLLLTENEIVNHQALAKINPPLRTNDDRLELISGYADGTIDCLVTDHAPHSIDEKLLSVELAPAGMVGLDFCTAVTYDKLVKSGLVSLERWVESLTKAPAEVLKHQHIGKLEVGAAGDLVIFNPNAQWTIEQNQFFSKCKVSLYDGWHGVGKVVCTIYNGQVVFNHLY